jgi:hypothetical protein
MAGVQRAGALLVLSLTVLSGCVVGGVTTGAPSGSRGPDGFELTPTCALTSVQAATPVVHGWRVTAAQRVVRTSGRIESDVAEADSPARARVTWTADGIGVIADVLRLLAPQVKAQFSTEPSPGGAEVTAVRAARRPADGIHVAYAAVRAVSVDFTGICSDGTGTSGTLVSWTGSEIDVVGCPEPAGVRVTDAGRLAQQRYCRT